MRATAYLIPIASLLSVLVVFATVPATAAAPQGGSTTVGSPLPMNSGSPGNNPGGTQPAGGSPQASATPPGPAAAAKGGEGVVVSVDQPDNCLRIRSGPGTNFPMMGCATMGQKLPLTGVFSSDGRWAQLQNKGWVFLSQIRTDLPLPRRSMASSPSEGRWRGPAGSSYYYEEEPEPQFEETIPYGGFYYGHPWRFRHHRWHRRWGGGGHHGGGNHH